MSRSGADLTGAGTPAHTWRAAGIPDRLPSQDLGMLLPDTGRVVIVAPHPDDEVLGAGGALRRLSALGAQIAVIAVTDGEASHPGLIDRLRTARPNEQNEALRRLGLGRFSVIRLHLPDGRLHCADVVDAIAPLIHADDVVLAPWRQDGHPDHNACGDAARLVTASLWSYLVWAWHWATPAVLPLDRAVRIALSNDDMRAKKHAVQAFNSQLTWQPVVLPPLFLDRFRADEVLLR